jgi:hypothetical protein
MTDKKRAIKGAASGLCYQCNHRRDIPGDAHSKCLHPVAKDPRVITLAAIMVTSGIGRIEANGLVVIGDEYACRRGWFYWPINFDPIWLRECNGFDSGK